MWQWGDTESYLVTESFNLSCIITSFELMSNEPVTSGCHIKHKVMPLTHMLVFSC